MSDHAPLGDVAFRAEPRDLMHSAQAIWEWSVHAPYDIAGLLDADAQWYEAFARDLTAIRNLPCTA